MRGLPKRLINTPDIEIWPAGLLKARGWVFDTVHRARIQRLWVLAREDYRSIRAVTAVGSGVIWNGRS